MSDFLFFNKRLTLAEGVKTMTKYWISCCSSWSNWSGRYTNDQSFTRVDFPIKQLTLLSSSRSAGKKIQFKGRNDRRSRGQA